jgi:hypothetical protein
MLEITSWAGGSLVRRIVIGVLIFKLASVPAVAQDFSRQKEALEEIRKTAADICYTIIQEGTGDVMQVSGEVQAKLAGLFAKLGELGIGGKGQLNSGQYRGVPWQDLASVLQRSQDCKRDVFDKLVDRLVPQSSQGLLYTQPLYTQPQLRAPKTEELKQSVGPVTEPPTPPMSQHATRQVMLACEMMQEQVLDYERTHREIAALDRVNYADRCQNVVRLSAPDETLRIRLGSRQFEYCVHTRDEILKAEAPRSAYAQMLARDRYEWNTAYCDRTDPALATTR